MRTCIAIFLFYITQTLVCREDSTVVKHQRTKRIALVSASCMAGAGSLIALNEAWYRQYSTGRFHLFNDNGEWLQMDKAGHVYACYQLTDISMRGLKATGFKKNQSILIGAGSTLIYMTAIECMDGFSRGWGFSPGDMYANVIGISAAAAQEKVWNEQKIRLKFSFHRSGLASLRPSLLGDNLQTEILKDYNGQSYWLSFNPFSFVKGDARFPKWLCLSLGYGAFGMLSGHDNLSYSPEEKALLPERYRRVFFSIDIDLSKIKTRSGLLKSLFNALNIIRIPAPAIEFNRHRIVVHPFYH